MKPGDDRYVLLKGFQPEATQTITQRLSPRLPPQAKPLTDKTLQLFKYKQIHPLLKSNRKTT